jgi:hypothetical protein
MRRGLYASEPGDAPRRSAGGQGLVAGRPAGSSPESEEVRRRVERLFTSVRFATALLVPIVLDMVAKPSC